MFCKATHNKFNEGSWYKASKRILGDDWRSRIFNKIHVNTNINEYKKIRKFNVNKRERYLNSTDRCGSRILARLRSGNSTMEVSRGRKQRITGKKIERKYRFCKMCTENNATSGPVEDIKHFILYCKAYKKEREAILRENNWQFLNEIIYKRRMLGNCGSTEKNAMKEITNHLRFIRNIYNKRNIKLFNKSINEEWWTTREG